MGFGLEAGSRQLGNNEGQVDDHLLVAYGNSDILRAAQITPDDLDLAIESAGRPAVLGATVACQTTGLCPALVRNSKKMGSLPPASCQTRDLATDNTNCLIKGRAGYWARSGELRPTEMKTFAQQR
jgi:hypothetical protein